MFRQYYGTVCDTINRYLRDRIKTEDVAQEMFAELWTKRSQLTIHTSIPAYLRRNMVPPEVTTYTSVSADAPVPVESNHGPNQ